MTFGTQSHGGRIVLRTGRGVLLVRYLRIGAAGDRCCLPTGLRSAWESGVTGTPCIHSALSRQSRSNVLGPESRFGGNDSPRSLVKTVALPSVVVTKKRMPVSHGVLSPAARSPEKMATQLAD